MGALMRVDVWVEYRAKAALLVFVAASAAGCGGASPAAPTSPPPVVNPAPTVVMFSGHLTATNGQQPLPNVRASFGSAITALTDGAGMFTMRFQPGTTSLLTLEGDVYIEPMRIK